MLFIKSPLKLPVDIVIWINLFFFLCALVSTIFECAASLKCKEGCVWTNTMKLTFFLRYCQKWKKREIKINKNQFAYLNVDFPFFFWCEAQDSCKILKQWQNQQHWKLSTFLFLHILTEDEGILKKGLTLMHVTDMDQWIHFVSCWPTDAQPWVTHVSVIDGKKPTLVWVQQHEKYLSERWREINRKGWR